jgi:hypothetical protein
MNPLKTYKNIRQLPQVGKPAQRTGSEISNNSCPRLSRQLLYSPCKCNEVEFKWEYLVGPPSGYFALSVSPKTLSKETPFSEEISQSITNFFQDLVSGSLNFTAKEFTNESIGAISNFFQELTQDIPEPTTENNTLTQPIFQAIVNFLTQED